MNSLFFTHQHRRSTKTLRLHYGLEVWSMSSRSMKERSTDTKRRKVYPPNTNTSLNSRCWNTFMISKMIWERRVGVKERLQGFLKPHLWGEKTQMQNWGSSLSDINDWNGGNDLIKKYRPSTNWLWDMIRVTFLVRIILTFLLTLGSNTTIYYDL